MSHYNRTTPSCVSNGAKIAHNNGSKFPENSGMKFPTSKSRHRRPCPGSEVPRWFEVRKLWTSSACIRVSISEIARRTGYDRKTIRRILKEGPARERPQPQRSSKLDPHKPYILARMEAGVLNAVRIHRELL